MNNVIVEIEINTREEYDKIFKILYDNKLSPFPRSMVAKYDHIMIYKHNVYKKITYQVYNYSYYNLNPNQKTNAKEFIKNGLGYYLLEYLL